MKRGNVQKIIIKKAAKWKNREARQALARHLNWTRKQKPLEF